jgi:fimbrial chaperone protein
MMRFIAGCLVAAFMSITPAAAMVVQPMVVDLVPGTRQSSTSVTVENTFSQPLTVELRVHDAEPGETGLATTTRESNDLLAFPPQALIPPGQTQTFRIQWVGEVVPSTSRHYFVTVAQLPVEFPEGQSAVQLLYNFDIAVNVAVPTLQPDISVTAAEAWVNPANGKVRPRVTFANASDTYGYVSDGRVRVTFTAPDGRAAERVLSPRELRDGVGFGLVGAHGTRTLVLPVDVATAGGAVEAVFIPSR